VLANERRRALDGGPGGTAVLVRVVEAASRWLRPGGRVLLELGGDQANELRTVLGAAGFSEIRVLREGDGQDRAIEARRPLAIASPSRSPRDRRWNPAPRLSWPSGSP